MNIRRMLHEHPALLVILLLFLTLFPLMCLRDFTPSNELRYLNIIDEAIADGKLFAFTCHGELYADKPPFFFWLMMLCRIICGKHCMLAYSMLTFIPACVIISLMDKWAANEFGLSFRERLATSLMLATTVLFLGMTVVIRMDMMMCMWIVLALYVFWQMCSGQRSGYLHSWLLPLLIFMALFTKGPVGLIMPVVSIIAWLAYSFRLSEIGRYLGWRTWLVLSVLCALWFIGAYKDGGKAYLDNLLFHQTIDRAVNSFHHKEPFWYYGKVFWGVVAPWCLAVIPAFLLSVKQGRKGEVPYACAFFSVCALGCLLVLSLFSSKLSIYLGPIIPFSIFVLPVWMCKSRNCVLFNISLAVPSIIFTVTGLCVMAVSCLCMFGIDLPRFLSYSFLGSAWVLFGGIILAVGGFLSLVFIFQGRWDWHVPVSVLSFSVVLLIFCASFKIHDVNDYVGYGNMCSAVPQGVEVYTVCVKRPENMNIYLGREVRDFGGDVGAFLVEAPSEGALMVRTSVMESNPELVNFVAGMDCKAYGKFSLIWLSTGKSTSSRN